MRNEAPIDLTLTMFAVGFCLEAENLSSADECTSCSSIEDAVVLREEITQLAPMGITTVKVGCDEGDVLLNGSCMIDNVETSDLADMHLSESGFEGGETSDRKTWNCVWANSTAAQPTAIATAVCADAA